MVEVSNKHKSITVSVSSNNGNTVVTASSDSSQYWANQSHTFANYSRDLAKEAEEWANKLEDTVDGKEYSAKHYAELASSYIEGFENVVTENTNNIITTSNDSINQITEITNTSAAEITTTKDTAIDSINNTKTTILNDIEFVAEGEKEEIRDLADDIKESAEDIINRVSLSMFDTILKDHILTYEESKGLALQGTYVYKEAIAGSRYGYPDFYNKVVEEYNEASQEETVNGVTVKVHSNGHKFYNIADKTAIDDFFNAMGSAWFYGVDTENERVFLPRNNYFEQATGDITEVGQSVEAGLPSHKHYLFTTDNKTTTTDISGTPNAGASYRGNISGSDYKYTIASTGGDPVVGLSSTATSINSIYGNSDTVQPPAVKKLLYICVGNTTNYEGMTDVVNQGMEILEQVNQGISQGIETGVKLDGSNAEFPYITETYVNGTSWYRVYSDGWCEQGGVVKSNSDSAYTVTLLKPYINTNYEVFITRKTTKDHSSNISGRWQEVYNLTTDTFKTWGLYSSYPEAFWRTCGYIA